MLGVRLNLRRARPPHRVEVFEHPRHRFPRHAGLEEQTEGFGVFDGLRAALALVGRHGVCGVADEDRSAADVGGEGVLVAQLPELDVVGESEVWSARGRVRVVED